MPTSGRGRNAGDRPDRHAKARLDAGTITGAEFAALKAKALG